MIRKDIFVVGITVMFIIIGLTGCMADYTKDITIQQNGLTLTIHSTYKPIKLTVMGNNNNITIDNTVNVTHISFTWGTQGNTVRVSQLHNFTLDDGGERNTIAYYDLNTTMGDEYL